MREGEEALARGDAMRARQAAKAILARVPQSPLGLALLADACEAGHLEAELALTLEELAGRVASRADVWVRLGRARQRVGAPLEEARDAYLRALAVAEPGSDARREALLWLCDLDLHQGDGARAELWLERLADRRSREVVLRRAEARLLTGDVPAARAALDELEDDPSDGRAALLRGRALSFSGDAGTFTWLSRALVLDAPGASEALSSALAWIATDDATRERVRTIVAARGELDAARWKAAFARAEGRRDEARAALVAAVRAGDASAARPLLDAALEDQDHAALVVALGALDGQADATIADAARIPSPALLRDPGEAARVLDALDDVASERVKPWADAARRTAVSAWIPETGAPSDWTSLLTRLDGHARALHDLGATAKIAELAIDRTRPVRVAIVGEFNAGKSTFINALIGADVAPTGVLPTTATLHHLRYAPDPFARIQFRGDGGAQAAAERIVPTSELRAALKTCDTTTVARVEIMMPLASLTRVEILDTPGFNAPDASHTEAALGAFEEADAAIWLLDAAQPLKQSERTILDGAKAAGLPVQLLVNKADRLGPPELEKVMSTLAASLEETSIRSWSAPIALSARLALKGKLGDEGALAESRWPKVQELLDAQIVGRSVELKERGLRRKACRVIDALVVRARDRERDELELEEGARRRAQAFAMRAAKLDREADEIAQVVASAIGGETHAWQRDLQVIVTGRDAEQTKNDPVLARYRIDRATARLAPPLATVLARIACDEADAPLVTVTQAELLPFTRAVVRAFAAAGGRPEATLPLTRSAVSALVDLLAERATERPPPHSARGRVAELEALRDALASLPPEVSPLRAP